MRLNTVSPDDYKRLSKRPDVLYGFYPSPFGECLLGVTDIGICALIFVVDHKRASALDTLRKTWPLSKLRQVIDETQSYAKLIFGNNQGEHQLAFYVKGSSMQISVWEALLCIPNGEVRSYQAIAQAIGRPKAARAVANAIGANPVSYLIPCHRVLRTGGGMGGYRWGVDRKRAMLAREQDET